MRNREIKFRAWSKKYSTFLKDFTYPNGHSGVWLRVLTGELTEIELKDDGYGSLDIGYNFFDDEILLSQFTGLHDKNGKEIYEGDIVIKTNYGRKVRKEAGVVKYYEQGAAFLFYNICYTNLTSDNIELEIIGNVHQHPELLK